MDWDNFDLYDIAWELNLQNFIITGNMKKKINKNDEKILSDSCEALIGAIFIDSGINNTKIFIYKHLLSNFDKSMILNKNYKGMLVGGLHSREKTKINRGQLFLLICFCIDQKLYHKNVYQK